MDKLDMNDFLNRAMFRQSPIGIGIEALFDGVIYWVTPDGPHHVQIVDKDGKVLGRLGILDGKFVPA